MWLILKDKWDYEIQYGPRNLKSLFKLTLGQIFVLVLV